MNTTPQEALFTIYVIECEEGKYYVGKTKNLANRMLEHGKGNATAWTRLYRPLRVIMILENKPSSEEDRITKEMMAKYGINNVRGGTYTSLAIDNATTSFIDKEIKSNKDACYKCGHVGHFAKDCGTKTPDKLCTRCGRNSHVAASCYAKTHLTGGALRDDVVAAPGNIDAPIPASNQPGHHSGNEGTL